LQLLLRQAQLLREGSPSTVRRPEKRGFRTGILRFRHQVLGLQQYVV
jgi:hypothetical protein